MDRLELENKTSIRFKKTTVILDSVFMLVFSSFLVYVLLSSFFPYWDTTMYHMPFAARAVGIYSEDDFSTLTILEERYDGFPMLVEFLQGFLWKVFSFPEGTNFINIFPFFAFVLFFRLKERIPFFISTVFYFSIPVVAAGFFSSYVDVFTNTFLALGFIEAYYFWKYKKRSDGFFALTSLAVANNSKYTALLFSVIGFLSVAFIFFESKQLFQKKWNIFILAMFWFLVFFPQVKNMVVYSNPIYPQKLPILNTLFPNGSQDNKYEDQGPMYLKGAPNSIKFLISFFEINAFDKSRPRLWTIDQGDISSDSHAFRVGGYFFINILLWFAGAYLILKLLNKHEKKSALRFFQMIFALGIVVSFMPQSHELRYWTFLPLLIISYLLIFGKALYLKERLLSLIYTMLVFQVSIFIFVFFKTFPFEMTGKNFDYYREDPLASSHGIGICFVGISSQRPFIYRLSTDDRIKMQFVESVEKCNVGYDLFTVED